MQQEWVYLFAGAIAVSSFGFFIVAALWLKRMRETVSAALCEAAEQQVRTAQRLSDAVMRLQKQQEGYGQQIHMLAEAGLRLQQELVHVSTRLDAVQNDSTSSGQTLH